MGSVGGYRARAAEAEEAAARAPGASEWQASERTTQGWRELEVSAQVRRRRSL
jgi:hypothetical protein